MAERHKTKPFHGRLKLNGVQTGKMNGSSSNANAKNADRCMVQNTKLNLAALSTFYSIFLDFYRFMTGALWLMFVANLTM